MDGTHKHEEVEHSSEEKKPEGVIGIVETIIVEAPKKEEVENQKEVRNFPYHLLNFSLNFPRFVYITPLF